MVPDHLADERVMAEARRAADGFVRTLAARVQSSSTQDASGLAEQAGQELEDYSRALLDSLILAAGGAHDAEGSAWVQRRFHQCIGELGSALRDVVRTSEGRHAVAQTLQRKVFEAENELRSALTAAETP